jgi:hypothetical protein
MLARDRRSSNDAVQWRGAGGAGGRSTSRVPRRRRRAGRGRQKKKEDKRKSSADQRCRKPRGCNFAAGLFVIWCSHASRIRHRRSEIQVPLRARASSFRAVGRLPRARSAGEPALKPPLLRLGGHVSSPLTYMNLSGDAGPIVIEASAVAIAGGVR